MNVDGKPVGEMDSWILSVLCSAVKCGDQDGTITEGQRAQYLEFCEEIIRRIQNERMLRKV